MLPNPGGWEGWISEFWSVSGVPGGKAAPVAVAMPLPLDQFPKSAMVPFPPQLHESVSRYPVQRCMFALDCIAGKGSKMKGR